MSNPVVGSLLKGVFTLEMYGWDVVGLEDEIADPLSIEGLKVTHYAPMITPYIEE